MTDSEYQPTEAEMQVANRVFGYLKDRYENTLPGAIPGVHIASVADMARVLRSLDDPVARRLMRASRRDPVMQTPDRLPRVMGDTAEEITLARTVKRWSRDILSQKSGISVQTIFNIERGRSRGRPETLAALRAAFEGAGVVFTADAVAWGVGELSDGAL